MNTTTRLTVTAKLSSFASQSDFDLVVKACRKAGVDMELTVTQGFLSQKRAIKFSALSTNRTGHAVVKNIGEQLGLL